MNREKIRERLTINAIIEHCDRKTRMYEKACDVKYLETAVMGNGIKEYWEHKQVAEYLRKLKDYEDLEEQDRLLKLPCRLGDTVYILNQKRIIPLKICEIYFDSHGIEMAAKNREELGYRTINLSEDGIGVEWYKTEEEAKAAMDKLKGKDNKDIERDIERD